MARAYHRDQAGAPVPVYSASVGSVAQFTAFKLVLKACLVSGFGAQPAAGWELINEGTNFLVLRNGARSGYVCLTWLSGGVVRVYLSQTYLGMSGDVMLGDGLKSGVAPDSSIPQALSSRSWFHASASSSWYVVADNKTFIISLIGDSSNSELTNAPYAFLGHTLYVGEDSAGRFISVGGGASTTTAQTNNGASGRFSPDEGFTALTDPDTGLLIGSAQFYPSSIGLYTLQGSYPKQWIAAVPRVSLCRAGWAGALGGGARSYSGFLRGIAVPFELHAHSYASWALQVMGRVGPTYIRNLNDSISLGDGFSYFPRAGYYTECPFFLVTENPEFW